MRKLLGAGLVAMGLGFASASAAPHGKPAQPPEIVFGTAAPARSVIKCPCTITIPDGSVWIEQGATLSLSGASLFIESGSWGSTSAATLQNSPAKQGVH